jgi:hypothetical protein
MKMSSRRAADARRGATGLPYYVWHPGGLSPEPPPEPSLGLLCGLLSLYAGVGRGRLSDRESGGSGAFSRASVHLRRQRHHQRGPACRCGPSPAASVRNRCAGVSGASGATSLGNLSRCVDAPTSLGASGDLGASSRRRSSSRSLWAYFRSFSATSRRRLSSASSASRLDWARSESSSRTRAASARLEKLRRLSCCYNMLVQVG